MKKILFAAFLSASAGAFADCSLSMAFAGDAMAHEGMQRDLLRLPNGYSDFIHPKVKGLLGKHDLTFVNVETPLGAQWDASGRRVDDGGLVWRQGGPYSGYPAFNAHPSMAGRLVESGFMVGQLSNNHALDRGARGVDATVESMDKAGMVHHGAKRAKDSPFPTLVFEKGYCEGRPIKVSVVSCTFSTNGISDKESRIPLCFGREQESLLSEIERVSKLTDVTLFLPHWGDEYMRNANGEQRRLAKKALMSGATMVVGTHPHVLQEMETWKTENGDREVMFSLGNFVSWQSGVEKSTTGLLSANLRKVGGKWISESTFIPLVADMRKSGAVHSRTVVPLCKTTSRTEELQSVKKTIPEGKISFVLCD